MEKLTAGDYVHLHNHTQYSLLDGLTKIPALMNRVSELGMHSLAITDHGTMSGVIDFYKAAEAAGINPIIGMEAYISPRKMSDKDPAKDRQHYHLTLLAMNNRGYQNLMALSTIANLEGFYYRPRIDRETLKKYSAGLIVLSGCIGGELSDALRQEQYDSAKKIARWYKGVFGDRYYIELQDHGHPEHPSAWDEQDKVNQQLLKLAGELEIQPVVTCDAHYLKHEDQEAHEILLCIQTGAFLSDDERFSLKDFELHVADPKDVIKRWGKKHPELITNSAKIAARCKVQIELGKILIPKFPTPKGMDEKSYLEQLTWQGLAWRYAGVARESLGKLSVKKAQGMLGKEIIDRAEYELSVVNKMGFNGYFLIVQDFINWGKDRGIVFGPGRGSAASSILAYALRITDIDPLKYDLLFERFLNPDRISMPDMDIDIQDSRRDEVINYCIEKYGHDRVANIVTFGRMAARNSVRDVARVLQVPYAEADRYAKMIPPPVQGRHTPLSTHLKQVPELKAEYAKVHSKKVFDLAVHLEGTIRSHGVHAAGVVIAPADIVNYVPLELAQKGVVATQYSMGPVEDLGLLKIDFLGLSNLTIIKNTLRIVKKVYGKDIDISQIPLDDKETFGLLQKADTTGVFQLESAGMRRYLKQLKPTVFEDIIAMVALYRPGPMQWIDDFIARKHGLRKIEYIHPLMQSALENTYGVIVYQEQVMQISKDLCGFSGGQADTLRKAIGKKIPEVMAKLKEEFIEGAVKHSKADRKSMEKFWTQLEDFAAYCFNKVHSACYALIAYQTAYLKAHYPDAYMAALMTSDYDNTDRLAIEITECRHMGIEVLPPDVNESFHEFGVLGGQNKIRYGLDAIKNVGHGAAEEILRARAESGGRLATLGDYCRLVSPRIVNRKALESLIKAGAFDSFGDRSSLVDNIDNILAFSVKVQKEAAAGQVDLFGGSSDDKFAPAFEFEKTAPEYPVSQQLAWERELLGLYLSHNPLEPYQKTLANIAMPISAITRENDGTSVAIGGSITEAREISTKNGAKMSFCQLADNAASIEIVVFPKLYALTAELWRRDNVLVVRGKVDYSRSDEPKLLAEEVARINEDGMDDFIKKPGGRARPANDSAAETLQHFAKQRLYIRMANTQDQPLLMTLKEKIDGHSGETEVVLVTGANDQKQVIKLPQMIEVNEQSLRELAGIFGSTNVVVK